MFVINKQKYWHCATKPSFYAHLLHLDAWILNIYPSIPKKEMFSHPLDWLWGTSPKPPVSRTLTWSCRPWSAHPDTPGAVSMGENFCVQTTKKGNLYSYLKLFSSARQVPIPRPSLSNLAFPSVCDRLWKEQCFNTAICTFLYIPKVLKWSLVRYRTTEKSVDRKFVKPTE